MSVTSLELAGLLLGALLLGFAMGAGQTWAVRLALTKERERLDHERARLRELLIARTPEEAVRLAAATTSIETPKERKPPPPWSKDPRTQIPNTRPVQTVKAGQRVLQIRSGPPGNERIIREYPLTEKGEILDVPDVRTPLRPA